MRRLTLLIVLISALIVGMGLLSIPGKAFAENLLTNTSNINGVTYQYQNIWQITGTFHASPPPNGQNVVTFNANVFPYSIVTDKSTDWNHISFLADTSGPGSCKSPGSSTTISSAINAQLYSPASNSSSLTNGYALWDYIPSSTPHAGCSTYPTGADNTPKLKIKISDPLVGPMNLPASDVMYFVAGDQVDPVDNPSHGLWANEGGYGRSPSNPNVYVAVNDLVQSTGDCQQEIVVNPDGTQYLWPVAPEGSGLGVESATTPGASAISTSTTTGANVAGCSFFTVTSSGDSADSGTNADDNNGLGEDFMAYELNGGHQDSQNGSIEINVPGLKWLNPNQQHTASTSGTPPGGGGATSGCQADGGGLSWFICDAVDDIQNAEQDLIKHVVDPLLQTNPLDLTSAASCVTAPNNPVNCQDAQKASTTTYQVWSNFRDFGNVILVIAILVAVLVEAIGGGVAEAYTVKKMLPRILVAAILINLSIYIAAGLEGIVNVLGSGLESLLVDPFKSALGSGAGSINLSNNLSDPLVAIGAVSIVAVSALEGFFGLFLLVVSGVLIAVIGILVTLMIRQGLLIVLVVVSPVAFALYCLPNTEQYFKKWWDLFLKTLLVYPIVKVVFAMATISGIVMSDFNIHPSYIATLMSMVAVMAPLFLIPFAFKLSGGAIGQIHGAVSGVGNKLKEPINNARKRNRANRLERAKAGHLFRGENRVAERMSKIAQGTMLAPKAGMRVWDPKGMKSKFEAAKSAHTSELMAKAGESTAAAAVLQNDDLLKAALHGKGTEADARAYLRDELGQSGRELDQNVASITQARRDVGAEVFNAAAAVANAGTGTGYKDGPADMLRTINRVAGGDRSLATRMLAQARGQAERARRVDLYGAGFATSADQLAQLHNNSTISDDQVNGVMTREAYKVKSAGEIASGRHNALENMIPAMQEDVVTSQAALEAAYADPDTKDKQGRTGQEKKLAAERDYKQSMARVASMLDEAGRASPENAKLLADGLMSQPTTRTVVRDKMVEGDIPVYETQYVKTKEDVNGNGRLVEVTRPVQTQVGTRRGMVKSGKKEEVRITETIAQTMEGYRQDAEFQQMRREYGSGSAADEATRRAMAQSQAQAGGPEAEQNRPPGP